MPTLKQLSETDKTHWELHLKVAAKELGNSTEITGFLTSKSKLPNIEHPSYIHDWLEYPEMRPDLEISIG